IVSLLEQQGHVLELVARPGLFREHHVGEEALPQRALELRAGQVLLRAQRRHVVGEDLIRRRKVCHVPPQSRIGASALEVSARDRIAKRSGPEKVALARERAQPAHCVRHYDSGRDSSVTTCGEWPVSARNLSMSPRDKTSVAVLTSGWQFHHSRFQTSAST